MAIGVADREEFVEGEDDLRIRQGPARNRQEIEAEEQEVMEMHHLRPHHLEKLHEGLDEMRAAGLVPDIVVVAAEEDVFVRPLIETGDAARRS